MGALRPNDADATYQDLSLEKIRKARRISRLASDSGRILVPWGFLASYRSDLRLNWRFFLFFGSYGVLPVLEALYTPVCLSSRSREPLLFRKSMPVSALLPVPINSMAGSAAVSLRRIILVLQ